MVPSLEDGKDGEDMLDFPRSPDGPWVVESLPLDQLQKLTSIQEVQAQLWTLNEEETRLDADLDNILRNQHDLDDTLETLDFIRPQLSMLKTDSNTMLQVINRASQLAERISSQVRQLDLEQSRVKATIALLEKIQELQKCANGVESALKSRNLETAAGFINKYLQYDVEIINKILSGVGHDKAALSLDGSALPLPSQQSPIPVLENARLTLTDMIMEEFDTATQSVHEENIVRFFKLFPLVGESLLGLDKFSAFICGLVSRNCQDQMKASQASNGPVHADLLTGLFEMVATLIDRQQPMVEAHYGSGEMLRVIQRLQREADIQASIILNSFAEKKAIQRKLFDIRNLDNSITWRGGSPSRNEIVVDPRELDVVLSELASIRQKTLVFERFLFVRSKAELTKFEQEASKKPKTNGTGLGSLQTDIEKSMKSTQLYQRVKEMMNDFLVMEEYYIRKSIDKAIRIDEYEKGNLTSSCVDDVFYILKKCISRALATSDHDYLCLLINAIGRILETDYINVFHKRMSTAFSTVESKDSRIGFMILLNNIDVSCDYIQKLTQEIERDFPNLPVPPSDAAKEKVHTCLNALTELSKAFRLVLKTWMENLQNQTMKPRLRPLFQDAYKDIRYVLTEEEYAEQEAHDFFVKRFIAGFEKLVDLHQRTYTPFNFNQTIDLAIESITKEWEKYLLSNMKFNPFGGLRFDKDLRSLSSYLSGRTQWSVRDKFTRLNQISTLLNLEKVSEVYDCWGQKSGMGVGSNWRLTAQEARKILSARIDFKADEIAKLKL
ncbi:Golgi transport complex subunit 4 [Quaeritorhiza haematococci]|nr:Golgi transport complex subunit 4 [Quaeritorhiza haematococci]